MRIDAVVKMEGKLLESDVSDLVRRATVKHLGSVAQSLASTIAAGAPKATGKLASSLDVVIDNRSAWVFYRWPKGMPYGIPIESGIKPSRPPLKDLVKWVELKKGLTGSEARRAAFAIARKKGKEETPARSWFYEPFEQVVSNFEAQHLGSIEAALITELEK